MQESLHIRQIKTTDQPIAMHISTSHHDRKTLDEEKRVYDIQTITRGAL